MIIASCIFNVKKRLYIMIGTCQHKRCRYFFTQKNVHEKKIEYLNIHKVDEAETNVI